jgi:maltose O-acetyltransferase
MMKKLLRAIYNFPRKIKKYFNYKTFKKNAHCGEGLELDHTSDCAVDVPGSVTIGEKCRVFAHLYTQNEGKITIGDHTCIYRDTVIGSVSEIKIGSCVIISNHIHIYDNNNHPTSPEVRRQMCLEGFDGDAWRWDRSVSAPITICDNVWIGEYSAIMKGVTVGEGSIVAAHSVVTKDVPPYSIVAGNPARVVKSLES